MTEKCPTNQFSRPPQKIGVTFQKQLGDTVLLEPAIYELSQRDALVFLSVRAGLEPLLELFPSRPAVWPRGAHHFDQVIALDPGSRSAWRAWTSRARQRTLHRFSEIPGRWFHRWAYHRVVEAPGGKIYRAQWLWQQVAADVSRPFRPPRLTTPPQSWIPLGLPKCFIQVHPGSAWQIKSWPLQSWKDLLPRVQKLTGLPLVLTGGGGWQKDFCEALASCLPDCLNLAGLTSFRGYLATCAQASSILAVDGSAAHLGAAFERPTLTLFGPTDPCHWHWSSPKARQLSARRWSTRRRPPADIIPVEAVLEEFEHLWHCGVPQPPGS